MTCVFIKSLTAKNPEPTACGAACLGSLNMCFNHVQEEIKREMEALKKATKDAEKTTKAAYKAADKAAKKTTKKEKKVKDPNRVKKASSPYIHFCNTKRAELKEAEPELDNKAIVKKLGDMWNEIKEDPEKKAPYVKMEEEDKARYEREMAERSASESSESNSPLAEDHATDEAEDNA